MSFSARALLNFSALSFRSRRGPSKNRGVDQDLEKLGVVLGDRRKMLRAIANLEGIEKSVPAVAAAAPVAPHDIAERRQVTVMFSDLVGSTALSARMDPEDLREGISAYQKSVAETVRRFGGFVAKYMGDGVLVYFGYRKPTRTTQSGPCARGWTWWLGRGPKDPHAPPDACRRRNRTSSGRIGSGASQEQAIVGKTPNLAARLQGIAEPNSVVIAESTRKLVGNLFDLEDLGAKDLKGIQEL
jgi:class 3 adenylate cyclase